MPDSLKQGWFDKLFSSFSKDVKTTGLVLLTMLAFYQQTKINNLQEEKQEGDAKLYERIISRQDMKFAEQDQRINEKMDTVKILSDSSRNDIKSVTKKVKAVAGLIEEKIKNK
jgi:hypothetical protein